MKKLTQSTIFLVFLSLRALLIAQTDGTEKWSFATGGAVNSSPAIGSDGTVYFGSDDYKVYALNPDGTEKWSFTTGSNVKSSPVIGSDGTVYVGSRDNKIYALNPDGTEALSFKLGGAVRSSPALDSNGVVYVGLRRSARRRMNVGPVSSRST